MKPDFGVDDKLTEYLVSVPHIITLCCVDHNLPFVHAYKTTIYFALGIRFWNNHIFGQKYYHYTDTVLRITI